MLQNSSRAETSRASHHNAMPAVRTVDPLRPLQWLALGARDLMRAGWVSWLHGLLITGAGACIVVLLHNRFWMLAGALSGFLLVAPVLATSLYAMSQSLDKGQAVTWRIIPETWLRWQRSQHDKFSNDYWCMVQFGVLLCVAGTGWVLTSASFITTFSPAPVLAPRDFLEHVILSSNHALFATWLLLGAFLAAPIFASSVIAMPLMLDRHVTLSQAVFTSWYTVLANPLPLAVWAVLIAMLTLLGMATGLLGLIPVLPILGHASWHAYTDLVDARELPRREPGV